MNLIIIQMQIEEYIICINDETKVIQGKKKKIQACKLKEVEC
jgi:hypothetical protein